LTAWRAQLPPMRPAPMTAIFMSHPQVRAYVVLGYDRRLTHRSSCKVPRNRSAY
jgi:hypothetical protein